MRKIGLLWIGLLLATVSMAQKKINDPNAVARDVKGYHAVKVGTGIQLVLSQGETEAVAVSAVSSEHRDKIKTVVENGVLKIYYDNDSWKFWQKTGNKKLKAYVSIVKVTGVDVSSGAAVEVDGALQADKLDIEVSSGASFNGKVTATTLDVDQSSGSSVVISGTAGKLKVEGSSGSIFHGYNLATDLCDVDTSSGAVVEITVNKELAAEASSGGLVNYKGSGTISKIKTSSGGQVSKK